MLRGAPAAQAHQPDDFDPAANGDNIDAAEADPVEELDEFGDLEEVLAAEVAPPAAESSLPQSADRSADTPALQIAALCEELQEKDELVAALTEQLEEAANRLDRLHRAGADRISHGTASDGERYEDHSEIGEQLSRLTAAWNDLRAADVLAEINRKLDDVCDALSQPGAVSAFDRPTAPVATPVPRVSEQHNGRVAWEDMKAQLLRDEAEHDRPAEEASRSNGNDSSADVLSQIPLDPPAAVDLDHADRETLAAAVEDRDVFISHLIRRLRSGPAGRYEPINWAAIAAAPDDLRERLQELEARLQELLRIEECDMSLERARLARERARLEQLRREVERDARQESGGHTALDHDPHASQSDRRWLRVFGFGRKDGQPSE